MTRNDEAKAKVLAAFGGKTAPRRSTDVVPGKLLIRGISHDNASYEIMTHTETPGWTGYYIGGLLVHEDGETFPTYVFEEDLAR